MNRAGLVAFTGGGTGGHIYPGLAVADSLREAGFAGRMVWLGSKKKSDRQTVEAAGIDYIALPSGKLRRDFSAKNIADAFRVLAGFFAARRALARLRPDFLFSKGGYVSVPPCAAAASLGIPFVTHESDLTPGLATRLNARRARKILVSYESSAAFFPEAQRPKCLATGNPVRGSIRRGDADKGRALLGLSPGMPLVLFLGGSQGARQINELAWAIMPRLCKRAFVVHQTGDSARPADGEPSLAGRCKSYQYIREELPHILAAADIVVTRAGAASLWECAALSKPMILVPLTGAATRGDQLDNARHFEKAGAALVLADSRAQAPLLFESIEKLLDDPGERQRLGAGAWALAGRDAAAACARLVMAELESGGRAPEVRR